MSPLIKKILLILGLLLVAGTIVFLIFFYKGTLVFNPVPEDARIEVAGKSLTGPNKIKLSPGTYQVKVSSPGYVDYVKDVTINIAKSSHLNITLKTMPIAEQITEGSAQYLSASGDQKSLFYLGSGGKIIYQITNPGTNKTQKITPITPEVFINIRDLLISPDDALATYKKDQLTFIYDFKRYDLLHQENINIGNDIGSIIWSPDSQYIAYYYQSSSGERTLIRASKDNSKQERVFNFKDTNVVNPKLDWSPDGKKIIVLTKDIYIFDIYSKSLKQITKDENVTAAKFTPDSTNIIFNKINSKQELSLNLVDLEGKNIRELSIATTLDKVAWLDSVTLLLAYPDIKESSASDKLIKININDFQETDFRYESQVGKLNITNLVVLSDKNMLYFISNSILYQLNLESTSY